MKRNKFFIVYKFFIFFSLIAFVVTCNLILMLHHINYDDETIRQGANLVFINSIVMATLATIIDEIRLHYSVNVYLQNIIDATEAIRKGDFVTISKPNHIIGEGFEPIIDNINQMSMDLKEMNNLNTDFIANVSHEMKTPVAIISNYAELLKNPRLDDESRTNYLNIINENTQKMSILIGNILKLNKIENKSMVINNTHYNLSEQVIECILNFEVQLDTKNIEVVNEIDDNIYIKSDMSLLEHVWNNLISNAIKYSDNDSEIVVSLHEDDAHIIFSVTDHGCGISKEVGKHIFDKFYQGDTSHKSEGNGIGLALVKRIINIVKGEISVESTVHVGSTFTVRLDK